MRREGSKPAKPLGFQPEFLVSRSIFMLVLWRPRTNTPVRFKGERRLAAPVEKGAVGCSFTVIVVDLTICSFVTVLRCLLMRDPTLPRTKMPQLEPTAE